jgi:hypothetical protein
MGISFILIDNGNNAAGVFLPRYDSSKTSSQARTSRRRVHVRSSRRRLSSQENDTVVTQTAQHDLIADHEAHDPAVNLLEHCNSAGWQFNPVVRVPGEKLRTRTIIARSIRRSKTNEIQTLDGVNQSTPTPAPSQ